MNRDQLNFVIDHNSYLNDGTKAACVKVRDFLRRSQTEQEKYLYGNYASCVTVDEFVEAVETLMAFAFTQEDTIPERWHCDNDCHKVSHLLCPGECNIDKKSEKRCPYFMDEGHI